MPDLRRTLFTAAILLAMATPFRAQTRLPFQGTVVRVEKPTGTVVVAGERVEGWMEAMTMSYRVTPSDVLERLAPGARIAATVMTGNTTTLFDVRILGTPAAARPEDTLPPIVWICPSRGEESVVDDRPGSCPGSRAPLVPVRLVTAYSCLKVQLIVGETPGTCPVDRTPLVPVTAALYFSCKAAPAVREMSPGECPDGMPRVKTYERRPHGDHNPRHGGTMFMSVDQWHHLEGTLVAPGLFRVYLYDDLTRPLPAGGITGRVIETDQNGTPAGRQAPLRRSPQIESALEATLPDLKWPVYLQLAVTLAPGEREQRFDFAFHALSVEP